MSRKILLTSLFAAFLVMAMTMFFFGRSTWVPMYHKFVGKQTVADVLEKYGEPARSRLIPFFEVASVAYPPKRIALLGIKDAAVLELWAETSEGPTFIRSYPIKALSGTPGPKLTEGDRQVPEGVYKIEGLNPNSSYHLDAR